MSPLHHAKATDEAVIWHDVECGAYAADLPLWRELAALHGDPVLEVGCGTGRVALHLARRGHAVVAVDSDPALIAAVHERASDRGLDLRAEVADARELALGAEFGLVAAPMQVFQLLDGHGARRAALDAARERISADGILAVAIVEGPPGHDPGAKPPVPDVAEVGGWVYSSLPIEVDHQGDWMFVTRLRQVVAPDGDLTESVDRTRLAVLDAARLESEALEAGLRPVGRRVVPMTEEHVGSTVVLLRADRVRRGS